MKQPENLQVPAGNPPEPHARVLFFGGADGRNAAEQPLFDDALAAFAAQHDLRCGALLGETPNVAALARLAKAGFDLLSLAGAGGADPAAVYAALSGMDGIGMGQTSAMACRPKVTRQNGVRLGFLAFAERRQDGAAFDGVADILDPAAVDRVRRLMPQCDHVIVFCHAGLPGGALPLPEWRARYSRFVDAGATLVAGFAPGAPMGWEEHGRGLILHNLGVLADGSSRAEADSLAVSVAFERNGRFSYDVRAVCEGSGAVSFAPDEKLLDQLAGQNALFSDEARYLAEADRMCVTYLAAHESELPLPAREAKHPLVSFRKGKDDELERRALERRLLSLLSDESARLAVLRALKARQKSGILH